MCRVIAHLSRLFGGVTGTAVGLQIITQHHESQNEGEQKTHKRPRNEVGIQACVCVDAVAVGENPSVAHGHVDGIVPYSSRSHQPPQSRIQEDRVALFVQAVVPGSDGVA